MTVITMPGVKTMTIHEGPMDHYREQASHAGAELMEYLSLPLGLHEAYRWDDEQDVERDVLAYLDDLEAAIRARRGQIILHRRTKALTRERN